jgi:hypothetical protein
MSNRFSFLYSPGAKLLVRFLPIALLAFSLAGCGGSSSPQISTTQPPPPVTGGIKANNFGMQCGNGDTQDCEGAANTPTDIVWPTSQAQPGLLRLHDSFTYWSIINPSAGTYSWTYLDAWLDLIAQHQPVSVIQVFTWTPCWDVNPPYNAQPYCGIDPTAPTGTDGVPMDLTASGSASFTAFVTAFVQHCSAAGNCVGNCPTGTTCATTNLIQYYEMWNEWDQTYHWVGTMQQLYQMLAPVVPIIKQNVSNAVILTPSVTKDQPTYQCDLLNWLNYETANGILSDWIAWHVYMSATGTTSNIPEVQWADFNQNLLTVQQGGTVSGCSSGSTAPGWANTPWANTETNFNGSNTSTYQCPTQYTEQDCIGQIIRWQIFHDSNGASSLDWYKWNETIGSNPQIAPAYAWMMQQMVGGKFTGAASSSNSTSTAPVWSAPFTESDGTSAMFVWTTSEAGTTYSVPVGFSSYEDLAGNVTSTSSGASIAVTTEPVLLSQ